MFNIPKNKKDNLFTFTSCFLYDPALKEQQFCFDFEKQNTTLPYSTYYLIPHSIYLDVSNSQD